jgi:hypothetical protein
MIANIIFRVVEYFQMNCPDIQHNCLIPQVPRTEDEWLTVAKFFSNRWNFPNCVGALDGKHVVVLKPAKSGSMFRNYKQTFSIVLMAVVDAKYRFMYVNVGAQGRISDGGVYGQSSFAEAFDNNGLGVPQLCVLPNSSKVAPYLLVADEAFPLRRNIMKPYPRRQLSRKERIFNYRLSRARRVVENAFGILSAKFRVFKSPIALKTSSARSVVMATTCLHNFLIDFGTNECEDEQDLSVYDESFEDGSCENENNGALRNLTSIRGRNQAEARRVREELADYFMNEGIVNWQWKAAGLQE